MEKRGVAVSDAARLPRSGGDRRFQQTKAHPSGKARAGWDGRFGKSLEDGLGNSRTVVFVPARRRTVFGQKIPAPAREARLCLLHQSGHDNLHLSVWN